MSFESAPVLGRKEQGPDEKIVNLFTESAKRWVEVSDTNALESLRGKVKKREKAALRVVIANIHTDLDNRYKTKVAKNIKPSNEDKGLEERIIRLQKLEELAFAA